MKKNIHPKVYNCKVSCSSCNSAIEVLNTVESLSITICSNCHPFYTGNQTLVDAEGRVDKFKKRFANFYQNKAA